jgi:hypothetical protein
LAPAVTLNVATTSSASPSSALHSSSNFTWSSWCSGASPGVSANDWCRRSSVVDRLRLRTETNSSQSSTNCMRLRPILMLATTPNASPLLMVSIGKDLASSVA